MICFYKKLFKNCINEIRGVMNFVINQRDVTNQRDVSHQRDINNQNENIFRERPRSVIYLFS